MRGSITFKFSGGIDDYRIRTIRDGELDSGDLEAIAAVLEEEIKLTRLIATGEITPSLSDPTGIEQLHGHWCN
jgi:hypothetical protein